MNESHLRPLVADNRAWVRGRGVQVNKPPNLNQFDRVFHFQPPILTTNSTAHRSALLTCSPTRDGPTAPSASRACPPRSGSP